MREFEALANDNEARLRAANGEYTDKITSFSTEEYGLPYGKKDGCIQAAYIAGYPVGAHYSERWGIYFIGSYHESLGLEQFQWEDPDRPKEEYQGNSGPVYGSKNYVKCANEDEFRRALEVVKQKFPDCDQPEK